MPFKLLRSIFKRIAAKFIEILKAEDKDRKDLWTWTFTTSATSTSDALNVWIDRDWPIQI